MKKKYNLRAIMKRAHEFKRSEKISLSQALKKSWEIAKRKFSIVTTTIDDLPAIVSGRSEKQIRIANYVRKGRFEKIFKMIINKLAINRKMDEYEYPIVLIAGIAAEGKCSKYEKLAISQKLAERINMFAEAGAVSDKMETAEKIKHLIIDANDAMYRVAKSHLFAATDAAESIDNYTLLDDARTRKAVFKILGM